MATAKSDHFILEVSMRCTLVPAVCVAMLALASCGGKSDDTAPGALPPPDGDVVLKVESFATGYMGPNVIYGTVSFGTQTAGTPIRVAVSKGAYTYAAVGSLRAAGTTARFAIDGIASNTGYSLVVQVDTDRNGFGTTGDYVGSPTTGSFTPALVTPPYVPGTFDVPLPGTTTQIIFALAPIAGG
jgi:hypothetical protein